MLNICIQIKYILAQTIWFKVKNLLWGGVGWDEQREHNYIRSKIWRFEDLEEYILFLIEDVNYKTLICYNYL